MENKSLPAIVCQTVRKLRLQKGISQEELALLAELDRSYVSGIERGQKNITFATLEKIIPHICGTTEDFFRHLIKEMGRD
ncbi:MAG: helix-turn-helix transcriptional regulator [Alphaproteobacteria bacterium]